MARPTVSTGPNRGSYERPPTHAEYLAASPKTEILYQKLVADDGCGGAGTLCNDLAAVERPADESAPLALRFIVL